MQVEATFHRAWRGAARAAHEPLVAGALRAARLREERLRRPRLRTATGASSPTTRPDPHGWTVAAHGGSVTRALQGLRRSRRRHVSRRSTRRTRTSTCRRRSCGRAASTTVPCDRRPSSRRPARSGRSRRSCIPASTPLEFTAPNLQYLMDSPTEFGPVAIRQFTVGRPDVPVRAAPHGHRRASSTGSSKDVEKIVREQGADLRRVSGVRAGHYTFLADYLP